MSLECYLDPICVTTGDIKMGKEVRGHSQPLEYHSYNCPYGTGDLGTREVQNQSAVTSRKGTTKAPSWKCSQSIKLSKSQSCCYEDITGEGEMVLA